MTEQLKRDRQKLSSRDEQELLLRTNDAQKLVHDIIGKHQEYFADPENRLEFLQSITAEDFYHIAKYANARLRGEKYLKLKKDTSEKGGFLPVLHTPSREDKPEAFRRGYDVIKDYLATSQDDTTKKIEGVAMASEALIILVHPFNDGNGRTSRFMAKLIEDGATDMDELVAQTADKRQRKRYYSPMAQVSRESNLALANNEDVMIGDDERKELRKEAEDLPTDVEVIPMSIRRLLEDDSLRQETMKYVNRR